MTVDYAGEGSATAASRGWKLRLVRRDEALLALVFLPPALLLFTVFVALPILEAAQYSFFNWNGFGAPEKFVGLQNYVRLFTHGAFHTALANNGLIILASLLIQMPLALLVATMLADREPLTDTFRLIFFLPYVLAEVTAGLIWRFIYDGDYGVVAAMTGWLGLDPVYVLADRNFAIYAILLVIVWKYFGLHMILFIAGLQQIDRSLYEAARIDGAGGWTLFRTITLPLLAPTIRLSIFFSVVGALQLFDVIMPMTAGGPSDSTHTIVTYLYNFGIIRTRFGFGSAVGVVLFLICVIFAFGYKRTVMRND
ncbi:sugar ABC transporter permease [Chelativorans sp.]|uniref:carbohydrate ABC transporter permease n=1 Tax=Chelativorans sp. TaxID=2203393 RepID=UPI00281276EA|nr:sugar ABC transporter permease [Chelativorans sp.]